VHLSKSIFEQVTYESNQISADRGYAEHGWLKSFHSFSFAEYYDPRFMGFGPLRVINDDWIAPAGFRYPSASEHGNHYLCAGRRNCAQRQHGQWQHDSAGQWAVHERRHRCASLGIQLDTKQATRLLQIWIQPDVTGVAPRYDEKTFSRESKDGKLALVVSPDGQDGSIAIRQNARLLIGMFDGAQSQQLPLQADRLTTCIWHAVRWK
jgi:redox-sensitive bicupin YhaK (pirin superfamily)